MIKVPDSKLMVLSSLKEYFQDISVINVWEQLKGNSQDYFALTVFKSVRNGQNVTLNVFESFDAET